MGKLRALVDCSRLGLEPGVSKFLVRNLAVLTLDRADVWGPIRFLQTRQKSWTNSQSASPQRNGNSSEALAYTWKAGKENRGRWSFQVIHTALKYTNNYLLCDPKTRDWSLTHGYVIPLKSQ